MPKINTYELLKILVWFLSLSNIFREQHEHFLGPFWSNFYLGHFQKWFWGFHNPHFKFKWNLNMMHTWLASLGHTRTRGVTEDEVVSKFGLAEHIFRICWYMPHVCPWYFVCELVLMRHLECEVCGRAMGSRPFLRRMHAGSHDGERVRICLLL